MFRLWLGLKALALARIWRLWLLRIPGQAAPSRLGLAWASFGLSRGFCRNFGIFQLMRDLGGSGDGIQEPQEKKMACERQIMMVMSYVLGTRESRGFLARLWLGGVASRAKSRVRPTFWLGFGPVPKPKSRGFAA
ncbi:hypothetical protein B0H12DRAFT_1068716 [Mycena haematopus]|nr:hypothetical protein B0H12DRAFT_1068716 [Mycena haematopus]